MIRWYSPGFLGSDGRMAVAALDLGLVETPIHS